MLNYNSSSELRSFLEKEGLGMQKKFGQNFLVNPQIRQALVEELGAKSGDEVWEIGPGLGAMTSLLLERGLSVNAFEIDKGFIRILKQLFGKEERFQVVEGDVLKTWIGSKSNSQFLLGNLPYNIAAALLADLIEKGRTFSRMVVTVQKEVALRMAASAGSPDYSSFSVLCASVYKVNPLMLIRSSSFYPQPNVDSMGVLFEKKDTALTADINPQIFYPLVRSLFASRRKTVKNNLLTFLKTHASIGQTKQENNLNDLSMAVLMENTLKGNERAENLKLETFMALAKTIDNMRLSI